MHIKFIKRVKYFCSC